MTLPAVRDRDGDWVQAQPVIIVGGTPETQGDDSGGFIGAVGGFSRVVRYSLAVAATPDYSDGDAIGNLLTLSDFARVAAGSGLITRLQLRCTMNPGVQSFVHLFDANPSASTVTDNAAVVIHANDRSKILKTIAIPAASWVTPKGASPWYTVELVGPKGGLNDYIAYQLAAGRDLYVAWEADGTINFGTDTVEVLVSAENN